MNIPLCKTCHNELIQKNRVILFVVGILMLSIGALCLVISWLWILSIPLFLAGGYLLAWSMIGKGLWCRHCKKFAS